jgi:hypothetical protein
MDAPYVEGGRHVNAEHFAHGKPRSEHLGCILVLARLPLSRINS